MLFVTTQTMEKSENLEKYDKKNFEIIMINYYEIIGHVENCLSMDFLVLVLFFRPN